MKLPNPYACDICKRQKQDSNKWFKAFMTAAGIVIAPWETNTVGGQEADLCGEKCVHEWISRNLHKIN